LDGIVVNDIESGETCRISTLSGNIICSRNVVMRDA
jgi:hypothetical protein